MAFSQSDNLQYLSEHGYSIKGLKSAPQAQRQANMLRRAINRGEVAPTKAELRGHPGKGITKAFDKRTKTSYRWLALPAGATSFTGKDLDYLLKNSPKHKGPDILMIVTGIVQHGSPNDPSWKEGIERTYAYALPKDVMARWLKENPATDLIVLLERINHDIKWLSLSDFGLYYPKERK